MKFAEQNFHFAILSRNLYGSYRSLGTQTSKFWVCSFVSGQPTSKKFDALVGRVNTFIIFYTK
jgi:hypothetical protein